ncbi:signal peptidase II [Dermatobacter hominis]|uniref:signal peptidase II n=1 Tax=Dermatobacter hominis TaxID=2884263 RepID=UPI001D119D3B|nr:signal peptidase II [Dermatobacter hominis]UDY35987.1 signal peptidase II [Dermatobacter hominis]
MTSARRWTIVGLVAAFVLALDQLTKAWAVDRLKGQLPIHVIWTLQFNYAENTGMAFSRGTGAGRWISLVVLAIVVGLVLLARNVRSTVGLVLIGIVVGGAFGNLVDRVFRAHDGVLTGAVVDWIDVQWWPIFNIADAAVVVGGILVAIFLLREPVEDEPEPAAASAGAPPAEGATPPAPAPASDPEPSADPGPADGAA